ncbi:DUF5615 family PIN-like protein [Armatimonas sp.]|uniref:DUF5615 family PIN-like protein n=1 Tax=Armatimonas sp. TaxID=1872638 RepID=UPI0037508024
MKLLLDQGLPHRSAALLREQGCDAVHTREIGMAEATDEAILERAHQEGRAVITLDSDFHTLLARSGAIAPSVIRIRVEGLRAEPMAQLILQILAKITEDVAEGVVASVDATYKIRLRKLPL